MVPHGSTRIPCLLVGMQMREHPGLAHERLGEPFVLMLNRRKGDTFPSNSPLCEGQELALGGAAAGSELRCQCWSAIGVDAPEEGKQVVDTISRL